MTRIVRPFFGEESPTNFFMMLKRESEKDITSNYSCIPE